MSNEALVQEALRQLPKLGIYLKKWSKEFEPKELDAVAEDALTAYCDALKRHRLKTEEAALPYMITMASRAIFKILRRRKMEGRFDGSEKRHADTKVRLAERFEAREDLIAVMQRVKPLSYRKILVEVEMNGRTVKEIAAERGKSVMTIHHLYERAIARAREEAVELGMRSK